MPFTVTQFFEVFARYNEAIWPLQIVTYVVALACVLLLLFGARQASIATAAVLSALWTVNGIGYHWLFFSTINGLAYVFGGLFVLEAILLSALSTRLNLSFGFNSRSAAGLVLMLFASIVYPVWGWFAGHSYPAVPMFGVAPCPTSIFTIGILMLSRWRYVIAVLLIPIVWSVIGGTAAFLLGVPQDYGLFASGIVAALFSISAWRAPSS